MSENMINVLHLRASPFLGSPERLLLSQLEYLKTRPFKYVIGIFDEQRGAPNDFMTAIEECRVKGYPLLQNALLFPFTLIGLLRLAWKEKIRVICTHDYKSNLFGLAVGSLLNIPCVSVFHGRTSADVKLRLYERVDDFVLRFFDEIIAVSANIKNRLQEIGLDSERISVIPNGIDVRHMEKGPAQSTIRMEIGASESERLVIFAGRLSKEKGLNILVDAAPMVIAVLPDVKFVILGDGPEANSLKARTEALGLAKRFVFLGFRKNIQPFLDQMDVCVLPSLTEGMPLVILEAFAHQRPVVATRVGGIPELIVDGVSGLLVEPGSPSSLAKGIIQVLSDPVKASQMGMAGYEDVRERHSVERQVDEYEKIFLKLLRERK